MLVVHMYMTNLYLLVLNCKTKLEKVGNGKRFRAFIVVEIVCIKACRWGQRSSFSSAFVNKDLRVNALFLLHGSRKKPLQKEVNGKMYCCI